MDKNIEVSRGPKLTIREIMGYDEDPESAARAKAKAEAFRRRKGRGSADSIAIKKSVKGVVDVRKMGEGKYEVSIA